MKSAIVALSALMTSLVHATPLLNFNPVEIGSNNNAARFRVQSLPDVNFPLPRSWAGNLEIGGNYGNDSLFFWMWEAENWYHRDDLILWFQGGPACSSQIGNLRYNGPIRLDPETDILSANPFAWTKAANVVYIDDRIGVGFSTGTTGNPGNSVDATAQTVQWLVSFFEQFPELKFRKIHLAGASFAGVTLPAIADSLQKQKPQLKINFSSLSLGNPSWGNQLTQFSGAARGYLDEMLNKHPLTKMPADFYDVIKEYDDSCGYKSVREGLLSYPPTIPTTKWDIFQPAANYKRQELPIPPTFDQTNCFFYDGVQTLEEMEFQINGTQQLGIYFCPNECNTYLAADDYFLYRLDENGNSLRGGQTSYNIDALPGSRLYKFDNVAAYLNRADVKAAIHAPNIVYETCSEAIGTEINAERPLPEPAAYKIIPSLLNQNVKVHIFNGKLDYLLTYTGSDMVIQNMTWKGQQGFQQAPNKALGPANLGITGGQERGLSHYKFEFAGHSVGQDDPDANLYWLKKVVLGWTWF